MLSKLLAIARTTFLEIIRQPIFAILTWVAGALLLLNPGIAAYSLEGGGDDKIMKDVGLATLLLYGLLASAFGAAGVISREIESLTVLTVVSKPVSRPLFLFGKYLGIAGGLLLGYYFLTLIFLLTCQHGVMVNASDKYDWPILVFGLSALGISLAAALFGNFFYGWNFATTMIGWAAPLGTLALGASLLFDKAWKVQDLGKDLPGFELTAAIIMIFMAVLVLAAFAVLFSTRFGQVLTLTFCAGVFVLGLMSDYYFWRNAGEGLQYKLMTIVLPNFQFFWLGDAITQGLQVPRMMLPNVVGYAALYILAILMLSVCLFQTREVGGSR